MHEIACSYISRYTVSEINRVTISSPDLQDRIARIWWIRPVLEKPVLYKKIQLKAGLFLIHTQKELFQLLWLPNWFMIRIKNVSIYGITVDKYRIFYRVKYIHYFVPSNLWVLSLFIITKTSLSHVFGT